MAALLMAVAVSAQTVFIENMGTVSSNTAIATHDANGGFQNSAAYDFTGTGDVRTSTASSGYTGASGAGNVFLTSGTLPRTFIIAGINTADHTNLSLSFGAYKSANAPDLTTLHVDYSTDDGTNWSPLTFPAQATGTGTTNWRLITITGGTIPAVPDLWLRWSNTTADLQPRIDDITLSGTLSASCGLTLGAIGTTCDANTVGVDSYTLSIGYTGVQAGATVINNSGSGTVGGSDPTVNENGTIIISGITEGSAYSVTFDTPCEALTVSGASPECAPACDISLSSATATCNSITEGPGDTYNVSIPYTGSQAGVTVNYTGSGTVGGDNPASVGGGTIVISGITEGEAWSISLSAPCGAQTASGSAPLCEPLPLAAWDFTGENQLATSTAEVYDANLDASNLLTRGSGAAASSGANSFRTTDFQNNGIATNNTDYFQLTLSSVPGQQLSLSTIDARFNGTAGYAASPGVQNQFAYSLDGTTFTLIGSPSITIGAPATLPTIDLSGVAALQNVAPGTTITLRYYASGQTSTGGWGFNSPVSGSYGLEINGSFTPIVGCDITLGTPEATCNTVTAGPGDTYNVSIPYTGAQAGVSVVNNGASGIVGGDDPAVTNGGFITITGINETDGYAIALTGACSSASASDDAPSCEPVIDYSVLVINEVDYDNPGSNDNMEFVEILNSGAATLQLEGCKVELVNGSNGLVYTTIILPSHYLAPGDYFVVGNNADIPNVDLVTGASTNFIQNGEPDAVALRDPADNLLDAISYEGSTAAPYTEGTGLAIANSDDGTPGLGISRYPNGTDTDDNSADWSRRCISPGESNNSTSEFCICEPPQATAFAQCVDDNTWEIVVDVTSTGSGATVDITNNVNGASALAAGTGQHIIGPFNNNEVVDVLVAHADTSFCDLNFPGNFMNCFPDCNGVPGGWDLPGEACDDNDPETMNDTWSPGCVCSGTPLQPTVSFSLPFSSVGEDGVSLTVGVEMDVAPSAPVTVEVTDLLTGNATSGSDYGTIGTVSFTFLPEDFYPALVTFNVSITDDTEDEPAETLNLTLSVTSGAATVGNGTFTGMITDNDLPALVINEVDYDNAGTDNTEWLELKNAGASAIDLDGFKVELVNGASGGASVYKTITLPAYALAAGDYYVIGNNASIPNIDLVVTPALDLIQNGAPDAIGLRAPDNTLIDAISYEGNSGAPYTEGSGLPIAQADDNTTASKVIARYLDGNDTNDNSTDWKVWCSTPGASNATVDQDGDLTADCLDGCPADANKTAPGVCGCGVPDSPITWYADADGDSFGDPNSTTSAAACAQPNGFVSNDGDCDDTDGSRHPGATEVWYDGIDQNCDGLSDYDQDGDGYLAGGFGGNDCDDTRSNVHPGATEVCDVNYVDEDCDGVANEGDNVFYRDADGDTYGDASMTVSLACTSPPAGYVSNDGDCDDTDADRHPDADEDCDGIDQDCDLLVDEGTNVYFHDGDNDGFGDASSSVSLVCTSPPNGYVSNDGDCDDTDGSRHPGATEVWYDGIDQNCDGLSDYDQDGDGYLAGGFGGNDCDDTRSNVHPGATEVCDVNYVDEDCDGVANEGDNVFYRDADGDTYGDASVTVSLACTSPPNGYVTNADDCDDTDPAIHPGIVDMCDGIDNDCDGSTDEDFVATDCLSCENGTLVDASLTWYADADNDGYGNPNSTLSACEQPQGHVSNFGDCNDSDANLTVIGLPCDDGDSNTTGDLVTVDCTCVGTPVGGPCTQNEMALELTTDATPAQTTWEIVMDDTDDAVCSGGGYAANTTINAACCLPNGCYDLKVYDSAGDGISPGGFTLRDANGQRIIDNSGNGAFFAFESTAPFSFCLPLGNTAFDAASCDILDATPNTVLHVVPDPAVTAVYQPGSTWANSNAGYQYWLFNPHGGYNRRITLTHAIQGSGYPVGTPINLRCSYLKLSQMQSFPVPLGVPLNIRVRTLLNAVYGEWGPACKLLMPTPACPPSQLTTTASPVVSCGATDLSNSSTIYANNVLSATTYQFEFSRPGYLRRIASTTRAQSLNFYTYPLVDNTCYNVRVRVSFDGGTTYCPFGPYCTITLGSADCGFEGMAPLVDDSDYADLVIAEAELTLWPNPNDGSLVNIALNGIDPSLPTVTVDITDAFGKLVASRTIPTQGAYLKTSLDLGHELAPGLYLVNLRAGETLRTQRLVIQ